MFERIVTPFVLSVAIVAGALAASGCAALAQKSAAATPAPLPPSKPASAEQSKEQAQTEQKELTQKEKTQSAKQLFGSVPLPSIGKAVSIGYYPRGCLAGGLEFPVSGSNVAGDAAVA